MAGNLPERPKQSLHGFPLELQQYLKEFKDELRKCIPGESDTITTSGSEITVDPLVCFEAQLISDGSGGAQQFHLNDPPPDKLSLMHMVIVKSLVDENDYIDMNHDNMTNRAGVNLNNLEMHNEGDCVLFRFNGEKWAVLYASDDVIMTPK